MSYPYVTENNLFNRQYYHYAVCDDALFLAYEESRNIEAEADQSILAELCEFCRKDLKEYYSAEPSVVVLRRELERLILAQCEQTTKEEDICTADRIVKTFEVRKRLYHCYSEKMKPYDERDFECVSLYVLFSCALLLFYRDTADLKYLNAQLKVNDILLSVREKLSTNETAFFAFALNGERECVRALAKGEKDG